MFLTKRIPFGIIARKKENGIKVYHFLVEYGHSGELYDVGCIGNFDELKRYFYSISRDVRVRAETESTAQKLKHKNKIEGGYILSCNFFCDLHQSITRSKRMKVFDERYQAVR